MTKLLKSCTWKIVSFFVLLHPIAICGTETTIKETTAINNSTTSLDAAYDISKLSQSKYVAQTPYIQNYSIAYAGQCGDYFLVPPNCTYEVSVNFGIHEQDLGNLYCVLTFLALGGSRRKFCLNLTKIHLTEDMDIYVFEGENMEYPELYQHIIRLPQNNLHPMPVSLNRLMLLKHTLYSLPFCTQRESQTEHLTNKEGPQIFCTNTNTLSVRFEYPILKGSLSPDVEFKVIPTDDVVLMKGNDCFKNFEMDNQSYYRVVTWPDSTDHHASWGGCFLTFVRESSGTMCVQFLNFYIGKDSNDVSLTFLVGDNIPMMSLNVNSSFPNATFCTPTKLLFVELRQKVTFVKQLRDYNFVFLVTAETLENGSQTSWSISTLLLISVAVILNFYLNGCEEC